MDDDTEPHPFTELRMRVNAALSDEATTVGATITWDSPMMFAGNQAYDDPQLSPVLVDECGRLWKEFHSKWGADKYEHKLVCILDTRPDAETRRVSSILDFRRSRA